jgi:uncharacterized protein
MDKEVTKILKEECNINSAQVTIDGLKKEHNRRRILKNKTDSFEIITKNIETAKEYFRINIRVNVDKDNKDVTFRLVDYFIDEMGWTGEKVGFYFAPVHKIAELCPANIGKCYTFLEFGELEEKLMKKVYEKGFPFAINSMYPTSRLVACGAVCLNNYVVDPEGYLYKCWNDVGIIKENVGDLKNGSILNAKAIEWLSFELNDKCKECNIMPICHGSCPYRVIRNKNENYCHHRTVSYKEVLKLTYKEFLKKKVKSKTEKQANKVT